MDKRPIFRAIWLPGNGFSFTCGDGSYYGWRWWIGIGSLTLLIGRGVSGEAEQ